MGDRRLTYRAVSYGTFLGQTYANMFPGRVRAMALDGLLDPTIAVRGNEPRFANTVQGIDAGLGDFESLCESAGPANCTARSESPSSRSCCASERRCAIAAGGSSGLKRGPVATRVDQLLATLRRHARRAR